MDFGSLETQKNTFLVPILVSLFLFSIQKSPSLTFHPVFGISWNWNHDLSVESSPPYPLDAFEYNMFNYKCKNKIKKYLTMIAETPTVIIAMMAI